MAVSYLDFVVAFPEFSNVGTYPETQINFWIQQAYTQLNTVRYGRSLDLAAMLFVAHNVVLSARAARSANAGGIVGDATGPVASKSVGPVSVSYDAAATAIQGAGIWNATTYGQQLYRMMRASGTMAYRPGPRMNVVGLYR